MSAISAEDRAEAGAGDSAGDSAYDVAVIGYGPTGVAAANLLGSMGLRVVVLERDADFLRVNERHHSIAVAAVRGLPIDPIRTRVQHLNIQAASLDDLAQSYDRVHELGDMALSVGRHTNDKELSYYARTPSGFEWEVGWNPIVVHESTWEPSTHQGISIWGHRPVGRTIVDLLDQFRYGARWLAHPEATVPTLSGSGIPDD